MKTLIVATDFSQDANIALEYAASLAKIIGAKVIIYNSYMLPAHAANTLIPADGIQKIMSANQTRLEQTACRIANRYRIETDWACSMGDICFELDQQVSKHKADAVVMGMRGNSIDQKLFGNTTTTVIRHAKFPVLVVPRNVSFTGIERILFACDLNCRFSLQTLKMLNETAHMLKAQVQVLHVESVSKEKKLVLEGQGQSTDWDEHLCDVPHDCRDIDGKNVIKGIEKGISEFKADMLVMVPQRYGFWNSLIHKSKTCEMAARTNIPLLSIPNYN